MAKMIFVNLPVRDLAVSKGFYEAIGFRNEPRFTDETAAAMQWSDNIVVMILTTRSGRLSPIARFPMPAPAR